MRWTVSPFDVIAGVLFLILVVIEIWKRFDKRGDE